MLIVFDHTARDPRSAITFWVLSGGLRPSGTCKWMGLDELETSWEPASDIAEDVPALVQAYIKANIKESSNVKKMATALALVSSASTA